MPDEWFSGPEHEPFDWPGEQLGALLIHGFMGTPREMRPLARELHQKGACVRGPVLPGFGKRVSMIDSVRREDWVREAYEVWSAMDRSGRADVLIGFSMGGSIAIHLAIQRPPRKLILLAPLWRVMGGDWRLQLLPVAKHLIRSVHPFAKADFRDPGIRRFFQEAMPGVDLDDPAVQQQIRREVRISTSTIDELRRLADAAGDLARKITADTLVIQGTADETVRATDTRDLVATMGPSVRLEEVAADHLVVSDTSDAWPRVRDLILNFVEDRSV